ncbi:DUF4344 domain-containing metallopeptidase [Rhodococcus sp. IEGM 1351]|uniref:DUF4344 domain-containing metallopeptidase n=1 Tax=Rhodococcus sp. IEGM 1351 TaxID=3047089 RepID=UPI0024B806B2|nr:DUF4344 domain-containing metallopeptidase [Rhodococcus sp. IEGM 1351]MDI9939176.1 DUF4344 domain-containing metallopeptidase [Rhodococcus sp. IEGM 1351]
MAALHARLHWSAAVAVVLLAVTVGCSSGGEDSAASEAAATTRQVPDTAKFVPEYQDAGLSEMSQAGHDIARDNEVIEELAEALGEIYKLPKDFPIIGVECGGFGVIWDSENDWMVLCYEIFTVAEDYARLQAEGRADNSDLSFDGITRMLTFHGSGHMAIDLYSLPTTGWEEDSADQLGALLQLTTPGPAGVAGVAAAADFWFDISTDPASLTAESVTAESVFAYSHALDEVRGYNLLCWDYGALPETLGVLVAEPGGPEREGQLPADRAAGCPEEYQKILASWTTVLEPYLTVELGVPAEEASGSPAATSTTTTGTR